MKPKKLLFPVALSLLVLGACSSNDDDDAGTTDTGTMDSETMDSGAMASGPVSEGVQVTLRNTLEEGGPEGSFPALFGLADDAYDETGTVSFSASEFPTALAQPGTPVGDISGLYDIDLNADSISYTMLPSADDPFWSMVFGVFPAGKFDRYYLTFSEPHGITGSTSSCVGELKA